MDMDEALAVIGRGHLVYRPKTGDYVTSVGLAKIDLGMVRKLHRDGLLEERPGYPGSYQLSEKGKEAASGIRANLS